MPRRKAEKSHLPKILQAPIEIAPLKIPLVWQSGADEEIQRQIHEREDFIARARLQKIQTLIDFYGVEPKSDDVWRDLCLRIAFDFISGFKIVEKKKKGAKKKWDAAALYRLWYEVQEKGEDGINPHAACLHLGRRKPWATLIRSTNKGERNQKTLYGQYQAAENSSLVRFMKNVQPRVSSSQWQGFLRDLYDLLLAPDEEKVTTK